MDRPLNMYISLSLCILSFTFCFDENDRLKSEVSDYMMHIEAQRDKLVSTKGGKLDYQEKMVWDLVEAMKEVQKLTDANMEYQKQIEDMKAQIKEAVDMLSGTLMTTSKPSKSLPRVMQYRTNWGRRTGSSRLRDKEIIIHTLDIWTSKFNFKSKKMSHC